jgi:16S rRNA processing protein RimM
VGVNQRPSPFLTVARLVRTHGRLGELAAELETDDPGLLAPGREVELWDGAKRRRTSRVAACRTHGARRIVRFEGIDSLSQAEEFAGWQVQIPAGSRSEAPNGRYYIADVVGCEVTDLSTGRRLGQVEGWLETGAVPLLEVREGDCELLVPFARSICVQIEPADRRIRVRLPEGLEDLNRS